MPRLPNNQAGVPPQPIPTVPVDAVAKPYGQGGPVSGVGGLLPGIMSPLPLSGSLGEKLDDLRETSAASYAGVLAGLGNPGSLGGSAGALAGIPGFIDPFGNMLGEGSGGFELIPDLTSQSQPFAIPGFHPGWAGVGDDPINDDPYWRGESAWLNDKARFPDDKALEGSDFYYLYPTLRVDGVTWGMYRAAILHLHRPDLMSKEDWGRWGGLQKLLAAKAAAPYLKAADEAEENRKKAKAVEDEKAQRMQTKDPTDEAAKQWVFTHGGGGGGGSGNPSAPGDYNVPAPDAPRTVTPRPDEDIGWVPPSRRSYIPGLGWVDPATWTRPRRPTLDRRGPISYPIDYVGYEGYRDFRPKLDRRGPLWQPNPDAVMGGRMSERMLQRIFDPTGPYVTPSTGSARSAEMGSAVSSGAAPVGAGQPLQQPSGPKPAGGKA